MKEKTFDLHSWDPMKGHVPIQSLDDMKFYTDPFFSNTLVISKLMDDMDRYMNTLTYLHNVLVSCFELEECRKYPVTFQFYPTDKKTYTVEFRFMLFDLIMWIPLVRFSYYPDLMDEDIIFTDPIKDIPGDAFDNWRNINIIDRIRSHGLDTGYLNRDYSEMNHRISNISCDLSVILGTNYSLYDIFEFANDPILADIMRGLEDISRPTDETEAEIRRRENVLIDRILNHYKGHPLERMLRVQGIVKTKQMMELLGSIGYKPNSSGNTIPYPIRNGYLIGGLVSPSSIYIDTNGAYKALINNKETMGTIGHFVKSITTICESLHLDKDCYDCGTRYLMPYTIKNKKMLNKLVNKYYLEDKDSNEYKYVRKKDTDLIGKTIWTRSIITCAAGNNTCCHMCLGRNSNTMSVLNSIGAFLGEEQGKNMEQNVLSTKHLLITNSTGIKITSDLDIFKIVESEIFVTAENFEDPETLNELAIQVDMNDLEKMDDMDDDSLYNTFIKSGKINIVNVETGEVYEILFRLDDKDGTIPPIYLDQDILEMLRKDSDGMVYLKNLDNDQRIFVYDVVNNEIVKKIYELKDFLWTKKAQVGNMEIEDLGQTILEYFCDANVSADIIAGETIINRLIRSVRDPYHRPDFKLPEMEPFTLGTIQECLKNSPSIATGLAFQDCRRQMLADNLDERTETSDMDAFFDEMVPVPERFRKKHAKIRKN